MRYLDRTTRIAIATLYLRMRAARERADRLSQDYGSESPATISAMQSMIEASNSLQAVLNHVWTQVENPDGAKMPTSQFVELIAHMANVKRKARQRDLDGQAARRALLLDDDAETPRQAV
jgi:hypothetical protein